MWVAVGMAVVGGATAYMSAEAANESADMQTNNANRKYRLESGIANQQMDEQSTIALEKMTDISREFLQVKSTAKVIQAETMVAGNTTARTEAVTRTKVQDAKGKVAKETDTNVVNIAQGMLASKIETEGIIAEANSKRKNVFTDTVLGAVQGGLSGYSMGKGLEGGATKASVDGNNVNSSYKPTTSANYGTSNGNWMGV